MMRSEVNYLFIDQLFASFPEKSWIDGNTEGNNLNQYYHYNCNRLHPICDNTSPSEIASILMRHQVQKLKCKVVEHTQKRKSRNQPVGITLCTYTTKNPINELNQKTILPQTLQLRKKEQISIIGDHIPLAL